MLDILDLVVAVINEAFVIQRNEVRVLQHQITTSHCIALRPRLLQIVRHASNLHIRHIFGYIEPITRHELLYQKPET